MLSWSRHLYRVWVGFAVGMAILVISSPGWAMGKDCRLLFQQSQYEAAARCFQALLPKLDQNQSLESVRALLKDRYLRNAAIAWNRHGEQQTQMEQKGYYKEQAIAALQQSIDQKFCQAADRCPLNQDLIRLLRGQIQYGSLAVVTGHVQANIVVVGYQFRVQGRESLKRELRPGKYTVTIEVPQRPQQVRAVEIRPKHQLVLNVTPAQIVLQEREIIIPKKIPPLVVTGYVVGGLALATGIVLSVVGVAIQANLNAVRSDPVAQAQQAEDAYHREFDTAGSLVVAGGITIGAGALILAGGVVGQVAANTTKQPDQTPLLRRSLQMTSVAPLHVFRHRTLFSE